MSDVRDHAQGILLKLLNEGNASGTGCQASLEMKTSSKALLFFPMGIKRISLILTFTTWVRKPQTIDYSTSSPEKKGNESIHQRIGPIVRCDKSARANHSSRQRKVKSSRALQASHTHGYSRTKAHSPPCCRSIA